jgi:hypothetical protein
MSMTKCLSAAWLAMVAVAAAHPGWAMGSCSGTYAATLLRPLPAPLVVGLVLRDDSPRNVDLASRFTAGMQQAGIAVTGVANMQLTLVVTLSDNSGFGDAAPAPQSDGSFGWWNGGVDRQLPDASRFGGSRQTPGPVTVRLRAELRPSLADPVAWVATLRCTMQGSDERQLAYDIGTVIGGAIGRRVEQTSF